jgi:O-methyltransferase domain
LAKTSIGGFARMANRPWTIGAWTNLERSVRTGISAFEEAYGMSVFDHLTQHAMEMQIVAQAMGSFSAQIGAAVADAYDFSEIQTLADIGGSHGMVLALILARNPAMRGILFDLPDVIEGSSDFLKSCGLHQRIELKGGNFFESVPEGADAYLLKHVLHDWSDENCLRILKNIHAAAKPATKVLLVEFILNDSDEPQFAKVSDLEMLVISPDGRERTRADWQNLLRAGGFQITSTIPTNSSVFVIEAVRG